MRANSTIGEEFLKTELERVAIAPGIPPAVVMPPTPIVEHPRFLPPRETFWLRLAAWMVAVVAMPMPVQRLLTWPLRAILRSIGTRLRPGPLRIWLGGRVDALEWTDRMVTCSECSSAFARLAPNGQTAGPYYCGSCGCPEWWGAALARKNWWKLWSCPRGKFRRPSPEQEYYGKVVDDFRPYLQLGLPGGGQKAARGGCGQSGKA